MSRKLRIGIVIAVAFLAGVLVVSFFVPAAYEEVCPKGVQSGHEDCKIYHYSLFAIIKAVEIFNYLSDAIIAIATIVIGLFTWFLFKATNSLASIASDQNELTKTVQRAYLSIESGSIDSLIGEDGFVPRIVIRNVGHLPAENVAWVFGEPHFTADNVWEPDADLRSPTGAVTLGPAAQMTHGGPVLLIPYAYRNTRFYLYIWGYVRYDDGFQTTRTARFSHRYNLKLIGCVDGMGKNAFPKKACRHSRHYNDSD